MVEVGGKGAVIGVGGRVAIGGPGGAGGQALTQARVGCRAQGAHGQLLGGDGAGVQQAGHRAIQFLQQHLWRTQPGLGWRGPLGDLLCCFTNTLFPIYKCDWGGERKNRSRISNFSRGMRATGLAATPKLSQTKEEERDYKKVSPFNWKEGRLVSPPLYKASDPFKRSALSGG